MYVDNIGLHGSTGVTLCHDSNQPTKRTEVNYCFPSQSRWSMRNNNSNMRRYATCVCIDEGNQDKLLNLIEFHIITTYYSGIEIDPFEALHGRKYKSPAYWVYNKHVKIEYNLLVIQKRAKIQIKLLLVFFHYFCAN